LRSHGWFANEFQRGNGNLFRTTAVKGKEHLRNQIKLNDIVSFKYNNISPNNGQPVRAVINRIRNDLTWDDILVKESPLQKPNGISNGILAVS
jgi:hypothetical protein